MVGRSLEGHFEPRGKSSGISADPECRLTASGGEALRPVDPKRRYEVDSIPRYRITIIIPTNIQEVPAEPAPILSTPTMNSIRDDAKVNIAQ